MKTKMVYEAPEMESVKLAAEQRILDGSVGTVTGSNFANWNPEEGEAW